MTTTLPGQSVETNTPRPTDVLVVGHVTGVFGLKGWVKVRAADPAAQWATPGATVWLGSRQLKLAGVDRPAGGESKGLLHLKFEGVADRTALEKANLTKGTLSMARAAVPRPNHDDGEYWVDELIGLQACPATSEQDTTQAPLARVTDVSSSTDQLFLWLEPRPEAQADSAAPVMVPFNAHFVPWVDVPAGRLGIRGLDELLALNVVKSNPTASAD